MRIAKSLIGASFVFVTTLMGTCAFGSWSQDWTQNSPPENSGPFTAMEFFIMPGSADVTFSGPSDISAFQGSSQVTWSSSIPRVQYSLLTGPMADTAVITTYFSSPVSSDFLLDFVLWNGALVSERQEFKWVGGHWDSVYGTLLTNSTGGFDPGTYDRTNTVGVSSASPVPTTVFLLGPSLLGLLYAGRRWMAAN